MRNRGDKKELKKSATSPKRVLAHHASHEHEQHFHHGHDHADQANGAHHHSHPDLSQSPGSNAPLERGTTSGNLLFIDAFSGIAGDMLVAAFVDLGVPQRVITDAISPLPLKDYWLKFDRVARSGIAATRFSVEVSTQARSRDYAEIRAMLADADYLDKTAKKLALDAFELLARAEAEVHGGHPDQVCFHEVGAIDSIVDIVAACAALSYLGARVVCSPLPMGRGFIKCRHGVIPAPAPATVLCLRGVPTYDAGIESELVTPTGACLVSVATAEFMRWPNLKSERVGWGAGTREIADRPNLLRLILGVEHHPERVALTRERDTHLLLETNLDDQSSELIAYAVQRAFEAGALDVWTTPIGMKKGRPATMISALVPRSSMDEVVKVLLSETSTLGLRVREVDRIERNRRSIMVLTTYGEISVKIADGDGLPTNVAPEYESCRAAAQAHRVPIKDVYAAALHAFHHSAAKEFEFSSSRT
jgi:pyridinium-3,5-bisthiocarboxylic acid mononucleotide nickel chelatase